ncbi:MAG: aminoglycoside phosphotransferase [Deltaproteobacteria bacterium]|nr:MAG: aminoglycoside phosphotransferase [Deltaproteobacteria bacterium]
MASEVSREEAERLCLRASAAIAAVLERDACSLEAMPAHASPRRYVRARVEDEQLVVMLLPAAGEVASEAGASPVGRTAEEPFIEVAAFLERVGVRVPHVHGVHEESRAIVLEDAGDTDFDRWATAGKGTDLDAAYSWGVGELLSFMRRTSSVVPPGVISGRAFTGDLLRWELDHYLEWRVEQELGVAPDPGWRSAFAEACDALVESLLTIPRTVIHRDFQSHNLMVLADREPPELVVIDFQDAMLGPLPYDAVAFLRDSYVPLPEALFEAQLDRWCREVAATPLAQGWNEAQLHRAFHLQTVQRKLKDAGRFVFIDRMRGNPGFLRWIPDSLRAVDSALSATGDPFELRPLLAHVDPGFRRS